MAETINVKKRTSVGSRASRRLRSEGWLPVVLYGHDKPAVSLSISQDDFNTTLRHGAKVVEMEGEEKGQALLQALQWDTFGRYVLHADLLRIAEGQRVHVEIEVVAKGEAAGESEGGVLTWINHAVEIEVAPADIPERLTIDITNVNIGDTVTAADIIDLPADANLLTAPERVLLNCVPPQAEEEEEAAVETSGAEPEVIGQKEEEESSEASGGES